MMGKIIHVPNLKGYLNAAEKFDWDQVRLNGGPPCFHFGEDGTFCGRARRWHNGRTHAFESLADLVMASHDT